MSVGREKRFFVILSIGLMFLFFLQLLADFVEAIFAFSLLSLSLNGGVTAVLLMLSPLILMLFGQRLSPLFIIFFGELTVIFRVLEVSASLQHKILFSGLGVGCFLLFFPAYLHFIKDSNRNTKGVSLGLGFSLAVLLLIAFKTINSSVDITGFGSYSWLSLVLAFFAFFLVPVVLLGGEHGSKSRNRQIFGRKADRPSVFLPAWGMLSVVAMVYFVFGSPVVMARWTEGNYIMIISVQVLAIGLFILHNLLNPNPESPIAKPFLILWNVLFVIVLTLLVFRLQVSFPSQPDAYPIFAESSNFMNMTLMVAALILSPILLVDISVFGAQVIKTSVSLSRVGFGFFGASLILLLLVFFHIFTTVYDYIPVVGPLFRDAYWVIHLLVGLGLLIPIIASRHELTRDRGIRFRRRDKLLLGVLFGGVICLILFGIPKAVTPWVPSGSISSLKVMTYNIQQGYDKLGKKNYTGQLEVIKNANPDIIGLQETDSVRIAGGNSDLVRYYADHLNMIAYSGPTPVTGTFGIALLSKYPLINPRTFFLASVGEQTAAIETQMKIGERVVTVCVTHLGNDGDMVQQEAILKQLSGKQHVILMGDFNFQPSTPQYELTTKALTDTWLKSHSTEIEEKQSDPAFGEYGRIDHIFASPEMQVHSSQYLFSDQSDHPALLSELALP